MSDYRLFFAVPVFFSAWVALRAKTRRKKISPRERLLTFIGKLPKETELELGVLYSRTRLLIPPEHLSSALREAFERGILSIKVDEYGWVRGAPVMWFDKRELGHLSGGAWTRIQERTGPFKVHDPV